MTKPTKPSQDTRAEEARDAEVAENYEEMAVRGAEQRGEGRLP